MSIRIRSVFFVISLLIGLSGCAPLYTPNVVNAPFHSEAGEAQLSGHVGTNGADAQAAFSLTDNIGVMVNYSHADREQDSSKNHHNHNYSEAGIGYYKSFEGGTFDVYGGAGFGDVSSRSKIISVTKYGEGSFSRYFLQTSIGGGTDVVEGGLTMRGSYVDFYDIMIDGEENPVGRDNAFFLEPAATLRIGYKYAYLTSQLGLSIRTTTGKYTENDPSDDVLFNNQPVMFSLGLHLKVGEIFKSGDKSE